jgi:hypothetical protein
MNSPPPTDLGLLTVVSEHGWLHTYTDERPRAYELAWRIQASGTVARVVRGWKAPTEDALFSEVGAALQFPDYFGENWAATAECLGDLDWLPGTGYVLVVAGAAALPKESGLAVWGSFLRACADAVASWAEPVTGTSWDRPARPFHLILHEEAAAMPTVTATVATVMPGLAIHPM